MSDCFDHMADAFDDYQARFEAGDDDPGGYRGSKSRRQRSRSSLSYFNKNPLYYHRRVKYKEIVERTDKAILFRTNFNQTIWVPLSLCRNINETDCYIWERFDNIAAFISTVDNHGQQLLPRSPEC